MSLTDIIIKNAKPKDKQYKLSDAKGLYLLVKPSGGLNCRFKIGCILCFSAYAKIYSILTKYYIK